MVAFLLALSLLLNMIALLAIILLFLRQNRLMETEKNQEKMFREMEDVISSYLLQMKEENAAFINRAAQLGKYSGSPINVHKEHPTMEQAKNEENEREPRKQNRLLKASAYKAVKAYKKNSKFPADETGDKKMELKAESEIRPVPETGEDSGKAADKKQHTLRLMENVLLLRKQGLTEDEIAKTLGKGKTEIALMLKFRQNQQE